MISFVCVLFQPQSGMPEWSEVYNPTWVDKLYRGVRRNVTFPFDFVCLTDKTYQFEEPEIRQIPLIDKQAGWGSLCEAWRPDLDTDKIVVLGLDTVITGRLDHIVLTDCEIGLLRDPYARTTVGNMVAVYSRIACQQLWSKWISLNGDQRWTDQNFLRNMVGDSCIRGDEGFLCLNDNHPGQILSYKVDIKGKTLALPKVKIVYFHGNPKPNAIEDDWILENWK
jgi:hypothetical protein